MLTHKQILNVIPLYKTKIEEALAGELGEWSIQDNAERLTHCIFMIGRMMGAESMQDDKANRWLGFIQGVLWCTGLYSVSEMAEHNQQAKTSR